MALTKSFEFKGLSVNAYFKARSLVWSGNNSIVVSLDVYASEAARRAEIEPLTRLSTEIPIFLDDSEHPSAIAFNQVRQLIYGWLRLLPEFADAIDALEDFPAETQEQTQSESVEGSANGIDPIESGNSVGN